MFIMLHDNKMCRLQLHSARMQRQQVAARLPKLHERRMLLLACHQRILRQATFDH
jgi:hypothetical protein